MFEQSIAYQALEAAIKPYNEIAQQNQTGLDGTEEVLHAKRWLSQQGESVWSQVEPNSLYFALLQAARVGLSLNNFEKYAVLAQRYNDAGMPFVEYMPTYHGYIKLAADSGMVTQITSDLVFKEDNFIYHGSTKAPEHSATTLSQKEDDRGELDGAYALAYLTNGAVFCEAVSKAELDEVEQTMKLSMQFSVWDSVFVGQMRRKTAIRRLMRLLLPQLAELSDKPGYIERLKGAMAGEDGVWDKINTEQLKTRRVVEQAQSENVVALSQPELSVTPPHLANQHKTVTGENHELMEKLKAPVEQEHFVVPKTDQQMPTRGLAEW
ncbi:recombinase RecT [uncultured Photobacterium sp.]|uniref:recombinase RecT n=1 Tax=uncultured Photobacterium sp. TaxID=173973 RepID=UPI0026042D90|nr:recombinase RecT [uncultured Photobacterium sp.]